MSLVDAFTAGLIGVFQIPAFHLMLLGIAIGFIVGLLPGSGGATSTISVPRDRSDML